MPRIFVSNVDGLCLASMIRREVRRTPVARASASSSLASLSSGSDSRAGVEVELAAPQGRPKKTIGPDNDRSRKQPSRPPTIVRPVRERSRFRSLLFM